MHPGWILLIAIVIVLAGILVFRLHAFVALLLAAMFVALATPQETLRSYADSQVAKGAMTEKQGDAFVASTAPDRVTEGFGSTCASIGVLIAMASIIGKCLLESGAADRIVRSTLAVVGQGRAALSFVFSGFLLGIPVFFDTVFYLMIPLGKAMQLRTGKNYLLYILSIVAGGTMAHSLVPPTPGPLIVASAFDIDLLTMIIGGCIVGSIAALCGYLWAVIANWWWTIPLRDSPDFSLSDLQELADRDESQLPPTWLSLLPIVLPVVLIAAGTGLGTYIDSFESPAAPPAWATNAQPIVNTVGDKNTALIVAAAIAVFTLAWQKRSSFQQLAVSMQAALAGAGIIILITAAGGAFGATVRQSGISEEIARMTASVDPIYILPLAFLITTLIRTAQGSATVAMITAAGVLAPLADQLDCHVVYLALAIGCGSKPVAWMADSGFWVICKMSGMTEAEGLKTVTPMSIVMGVTGLAATMAGAMLWPLKSIVQ